MKALGFAAFKIPLALIVLSLVPMLGGLARLHSMSGGSPVTQDNARFIAAPLPIVVHIIAATLYSLLGAFQFSPALRARYRTWHRVSGKILVVCGLLVGLTGIWMTVAYAIPERLQGPLLLGVRLVVGLAMVAAIWLGWKSVLRRDFASHEAWMIRAYALGQGAGMQAVLMLPLIVVMGDVVGWLREILMSLAWVVNLAVAEWAIRKSRQAFGHSSRIVV